MDSAKLLERLRAERHEYGYPFMPWHLRPSCSEIANAHIEQLRHDIAALKAIANRSAE